MWVVCVVGILGIGRWFGLRYVVFLLCVGYELCYSCIVLGGDVWCDILGCVGILEFLYYGGLWFFVVIGDVDCVCLDVVW